MSAPGFAGGQIDLALGSVFGVRRWRVGFSGSLGGAVIPFNWTPGVNESRCMRLFCRTNGGMPPLPGEFLDTPHYNCQAGFWAYHTPARAEYGMGGVEGIIEGWGETVIGERGFRSTKARIVALVEPPRFGGLAPMPKPSAQERITARLWGEALRVDRPRFGDLTYPTLLQWSRVRSKYQVPVFHSLKQALAEFPVEDLNYLREDEGEGW